MLLSVFIGWIAFFLPVTKKEKQNDKKRRIFHPMKSKKPQMSSL